MSKFIDRKKETVSFLVQDFKKHEAFLIFEYKGLNCEQFTSLRSELRKHDAKISVCKNNIINRSLKKMKLTEKVDFEFQNAVLFAGNNLVPIQIVAKLQKSFKDIRLKMCYFDKIVLAQEVLDNIASLKSKEEMLVVLGRTLMSPVYKLLLLLKSIKV